MSLGTCANSSLKQGEQADFAPFTSTRKQVIQDSISLESLSEDEEREAYSSDVEPSDVELGMVGYAKDGFVVPMEAEVQFSRVDVSNLDNDGARFVLDVHHAVRSFNKWTPSDNQGRRIKEICERLEVTAGKQSLNKKPKPWCPECTAEKQSSRLLKSSYTLILRYPLPRLVWNDSVGLFCLNEESFEALFMRSGDALLSLDGVYLANLCKLHQQEIVSVAVASSVSPLTYVTCSFVGYRDLPRPKIVVYRRLRSKRKPHMQCTPSGKRGSKTPSELSPVQKDILLSSDSPNTTQKGRGNFSMISLNSDGSNFISSPSPSSASSEDSDFFSFA